VSRRRLSRVVLCASGRALCWRARLLTLLSLVACGPGSGTQGPSSDAPVLSISPDTVVFDSIPLGTATQSTIVLRNTGGSDLEIGNIDIPEDKEGTNTSFSILTPAEDWFLVLPAGLSLDLDLGFAPGNGGTDSTSLRIVTNVSDRSESFVGMRGYGLAPSVGLAPDVLDFGDVRVGASSTTRDIWLYNSGFADLTVTGFDVDCPSFALSPAPELPLVIAPASAFPLQLLFSPAALLPYDAELDVQSDAATGAASAVLSGRGVDVGEPVEPVLVVDEDGDGFTVDAGDCDDHDPLTHPGSTICGTGDYDHNCDGVADSLSLVCCDLSCTEDSETGVHASLSCETGTPECIVEVSESGACGVEDTSQRCVYPDGGWYLIETVTRYAPSTCAITSVRTLVEGMTGEECTYEDP
jgi:hypothetical protein